MSKQTFTLPSGFVYLQTIDPTIIQDIKYAGFDNFLGRPVQGYEAATCILTEAAALQLKAIQTELRKNSLGIKIFDAYRPQIAVDDFVRWSRDAADQKMKTAFYPRVNKADFFKLGYVMEKSGHTRGSTVDLTLIYLNDQAELAMGTPYDFMDELSHPANTTIASDHYSNRMLLREIMMAHGFLPIVTEWWHFTLRDEPFKNEHFNFPVRF